MNFMSSQKAISGSENIMTNNIVEIGFFCRFSSLRTIKVISTNRKESTVIIYSWKSRGW